MIFARYIGPKSSSWTKGKIYFAMAGFTDNQAVDLSTIRMQDDEDEMHDEISTQNLFDFPERIYAVAIKPIVKIRVGTVIQVFDVSDGFFQVTGNRYVQSENFEVLDRTNVGVGNVVLNLETGRWDRITRLDDNLMVGFDGDDQFWALDTLRFPVSAGGILLEPILFCIQGTDGELTAGRGYTPITEKDSMVEVKNDNDEIKTYMLERFLEDFPKESGKSV